MLKEFISYLEEQVKNHSIYIWGGQGQQYPTLTEAWIKKCESGTNETKALKTYRAAVAAGYEKLCRAFDCSGLIVYWCLEKGLIKSDMTANGLKGQCTLIQKNHLKEGCFVFRTYKTEASATKNGKHKGDAYHVGVIVKGKDGKLYVVHAKGRADGVVKELFDATYWNTYGTPKFFADEIDTKEEQKEHASFNRNLKKGCKGDDVRELQKLLIAAGFPCGKTGADGDFGKNTRTAVLNFQRKKGLKKDGIAGKNTITALGGIWEG